MAEQLIVQGEVANKPEYLIALALDKLEYEYKFQYHLWGGQLLRGGAVIDFVVFAPDALPLEYDGLHWHIGEASAQEKLQRILIAQHFNVPEVLVITSAEVDADTPLSTVVEVVSSKIGVVF